MCIRDSSLVTATALESLQRCSFEHSAKPLTLAAKALALHKYSNIVQNSTTSVLQLFSILNLVFFGPTNMYINNK